MQRKLIILILACTAICTARPVYVLAQDPNCIQLDHTGRCPLPIDPNWTGAVLSAGDPNWTVEAGKFNRLLEPCDPDGDPTTVSLQDTNAPGSAVVPDPSNDTWILTADLPPGIYWWLVRVTDVPLWSEPLHTDVLLMTTVVAPINRPPVLHVVPQ